MNIFLEYLLTDRDKWGARPQRSKGFVYTIRRVRNFLKESQAYFLV